MRQAGLGGCNQALEGGEYYRSEAGPHTLPAATTAVLQPLTEGDDRGEEDGGGAAGHFFLWSCGFSSSSLRQLG